MNGRTATKVGAVVGAALVLGACGATTEGDVAVVAHDFHAAVADRDGAAACRLLAPATRSELEQSSGQRCARAVLEEQLPPPEGGGRVDVFDTAGEVRYGDETTFLGRFDGRWRVVAAGCTPRDPHPYDCKVSGG